ncbi:MULTISPECIES: hypothetical protein [unclassified Blastococcus]
MSERVAGCSCPACVQTVATAWTARGPGGAGRGGGPGRHEHLTQWYRDLRSQTAQVTEWASSACERSAATVAQSQDRRAERAARP